MVYVAVGRCDDDDDDDDDDDVIYCTVLELQSVFCVVEFPTCM